MNIGKKSNDATEKKGMALRDNALDNIAGGKCKSQCRPVERPGCALQWPLGELDTHPAKKDARAWFEKYGPKIRKLKKT